MAAPKAKSNSAAKASTAKSIKEWLIQLTRAPLPILPHTGASLLQQLQDPNIALNQVAKVVGQDPILTLHVLRQANKLNKNQHTDITNINHAITILGLGNVQKLSRNIPICKKDLTDKTYLHYLTSVMRSIHAAEQARSWATKRAYHAPDEIHLAALLFGVPMWCLWQFANHEMNLIEHLVARERIPKVNAEKTVLGCTTEKLCSALAKAWKLPEIVRDALDKKNQPSHRFVISTAHKAAGTAFPELPAYDPTGVAINSPAVQVMLANWLATETDIDWYSRQTTRCVRVTSAFLRMSEEDAFHHSQYIAVNTSRAFPIPGIATPAARMALLPEKAIRRTIKLSELTQATEQLSQNWEKVESGEFETFADIIAKEQKEKPTKKAATPEQQQAQAKANANIRKASAQKPPAEINVGMLKDFINALKTAPEEFADVHDLMKMTCETIHYAIGLERVVAGLLNANHSEVLGFSGAGTRDYPELEKFHVKLQPTNLFTKMVRQSAALWIDPIKNGKALAQIPGSFKAVNESDHFFLHSIFYGPRPVAIIYADQGPGDAAALKEDHYKTFKLVCNTINNCLNQLATK